MHILLVNTNPVVSRLISLNTRNNQAIEVDEISQKATIPKAWYDIIFVDEKCYDSDAMRMHLQGVGADKKILFSSKDGRSDEWIDSVIKKPFLPSEITAVLQSLLQVTQEEIDEEESDAVEGHSQSREASAYDTEIKSAILDGDEIKKIKQLLLDEGLELSPDEEYDVEESESVMTKAVEEPKKKTAFEASLLRALIEMKPKKIRKLLEGAEVSITIRFPKGES